LITILACVSIASNPEMHARAEPNARTGPHLSGAPVRTAAQKPEISFRYERLRSPPRAAVPPPAAPPAASRARLSDAEPTGPAPFAATSCLGRAASPAAGSSVAQHQRVPLVP
jgi:hypothetical protein